MQRSEMIGVTSLTLGKGKEAFFVGQQASCSGSRQEGGDSHELEETTDWRHISLPEGGDKWQCWNLLLEGQKAQGDLG